MSCFSPACTDSFGTPRAVGEVWKASRDGCCMYRCENDTIVPVEYNCTEVPQPECKRAGEVIISLADDKSCCPQKACGGFYKWLNDKAKNTINMLLLPNFLVIMG